MKSGHVRHCEERSDEAIQGIGERLTFFWYCFPPGSSTRGSLAMTVEDPT